MYTRMLDRTLASHIGSQEITIRRGRTVARVVETDPSMVAHCSENNLLEDTSIDHELRRGER